MKKFEKLSKQEMRMISGGFAATCKADCGNGTSVSCSGTCAASDGVGCYSVSDGVLSITTCPKTQSA
nr:hypothetical protein [Mucilaginibacter sp. L294]